MCAGDSIGRGVTFDEHLGNSKKVNDALIADSAASKADILVSEDIRLIQRFKNIGSKCRVKNYSRFIVLAKQIESER